MGKLVYVCTLCLVLYLRFGAVSTQNSDIPSPTTDIIQSTTINSSTLSNESSPSSDVDSNSSTESSVDPPSSNIPESTIDSVSTQEDSSSTVDPNTSESSVDPSYSDISESTIDSASTQEDTSSTVDPNSTSESSVDPSFSDISESTIDSASTQEDSSSTVEPNSTSESSTEISEFTVDSSSTNSESTTSSSESTFVSDGTTATSIPTTPPPKNLVETRFTWTENNAAIAPSQVVIVASGYYISVTVSNLVLTDDSYLLLVAGTSYTTEAVDGRVFANSVAGPVSYLFQTNKVYVFFSPAETEGSNKFTVVFERVGGVTTTVPTTYTTPINWPSTEKSDSVYITVHINSRKLKDYSWEVINAFRNCVALMAIQYCEKEQIPVTDPGITFNNVLIQRLEECPYSWPNRDNCVQIRFRLPIFYNTSILHDGYLLNTTHLERMWVLYSKTNQCFDDNSFSAYSEPDMDKSILQWAVGITLVTLLFIILLVFLKVCSSRFEPLRNRRKRRNSDTVSMVSSKRDSVSSLSPHYLQHMDTPKFFDQ